MSGRFSLKETKMNELVIWVTVFVFGKGTSSRSVPLETGL
jgi:hypothetical protein